MSDKEMSDKEVFPPVTPDMVPPHGMRVKLGPWAHRAAGEGADGTVEALSGLLRIRRFKAHLLVQGKLNGAFTVRCDLCREPLAVKFAADLNCVYSPMSLVPSREEDEEGDFPMPEEITSIGEPVDDQGEYTGEALDLQDVVREVFALERPPVYRCDEVAPSTAAACEARWKRAAGQAGAPEGAADAVTDTVGPPLTGDPAIAGNAFAALAGFKPTR